MGELVRGRCRSTNQCDYCARLAAVENSECLAIDALETGGPSIWAVLTTRTSSIEPSEFYAARRKLHLALKRRWPDVEYAALVEFTTGYASRSGGKRRPHWNLLLKNVPAGAQEDVEAVIRKVWCSRVDALPKGQYVGTVEEAGGLMRYLALHFQKEEQSPPKGWRGHRFLHSRGYFGKPMPEVRAQAREQLQVRRDLYKLQKAHPDLEAVELHELAQREAKLRAETSWELVQIYELAGVESGTQRRSRFAQAASRQPGAGARPSPESRPPLAARTDGRTDAARRPRGRPPAHLRPDDSPPEADRVPSPAECAPPGPWSVGATPGGTGPP